MRLGIYMFLGLLLGFSQQSIAEVPAQYLGLFYADSKFDPEKGSRVDETDFNLKLGYDFSDFWGIETRIGASLSENGSNNDGVFHVSGMLRGNLPLERINIYGLIGVTGLKVSYSKNFNDNFVVGAYGIGIELFGNKTTALGIEFLQQGINDSYMMVGLGIVHHFNFPRLR